jgi:O-antigen ligase
VVGEYQYAEQRDKYGRDLGGSIIAHSLFVELIAEIGTIGALVVLALLWRTVRDLRQVIRMAGQQQVAEAPRDEVALRCYADAVIGATIACLVNGVFLSLLYYSYFWLFTVLASAIWYVAQDKIASSRPETGGQEPPRQSRLMAPVPAPRRHPRR